MTHDEVVRMVHASYDAFNRGDFDTAMAWAHPDVEYIPIGGQSPIRGADGVRAWMEPSAFEWQTIEAREIVVNDDRALVRIHSASRGAGSGIEMEIGGWVVLTQDSDGLVTRVELFYLHEEEQARAAAGLGIRRSG